MTILIRRARTPDAETIADFNQLMAVETENKHLAREVIVQGVTRMLADEDLGFYLVAGDQDGTILGCLGITYEWSDWRNGLFWWIQSVYVARQHRGRGVFSSLYEHVKTQAGSNPEVCGIRLYVEKDNLTAQRTYLRLGMIETEYRIMEESFS